MGAESSYPTAFAHRPEAARHRGTVAASRLKRAGHKSHNYLMGGKPWPLRPLAPYTVIYSPLQVTTLKAGVVVQA